MIGLLCLKTAEKIKGLQVIFSEKFQMSHLCKKKKERERERKLLYKRNNMKTKANHKKLKKYDCQNKNVF